MKRIRELLSALRVFKRLREAEAHLALAIAQIEEHYRVFKTISGCKDCGAVQVVGHPNVGKYALPAETDKDGNPLPVQIEIRCQFHQKVLEERSAKVVKLTERRRNGIIVPGA